MNKEGILKYGRPGLLIAIAVVMAMLTVMFPVHIELVPSQGSTMELHQGTFRITIGNKVNAQAANYTCDGTNDDVEFQQALDALPAIGGQLLVLAGIYDFTDATTVTRDIPNVTIMGIGASVTFNGDDSTPIFTAGDDNWLFSNFQTDAGGMEMGATSNWLWINVIVDGTLYPLEPALTDINDLIDAVEADVVTLESGLGELNATIIQYGINISGLEDDMVIVQGDLATLQDDVEAINTTVGYYSGNISALQSDVSGLQNSVSALQGNVSALQGDVSDLQDDLSDVQDDLAALTTTVGYHTGNISALQNDLAALTTTVGYHTGNISALQNDLAALTTTVGYHTGNISALQSSMTSLNNTLNWHTGNTTGVHGGMIGDNDGDTIIQTQESADEDKIRMDVNGTEAFHLSNLGILTLAKQSVAIAYANTSQSIPVSTLVKIQLNKEISDIQNEFDPSTNYRFTVKEAGLYLLVSTIRWSALTSSGRILNDLFKNGALYQSSETYAVSGSYQNTDLTTVAWLNANDYIESYVYQTTSGTQSTYVGETLTKLCIVKLT